MNRTSFAHLYSFESHWLDRGGLRLHYLDEGPGGSAKRRLPATEGSAKLPLHSNDHGEPSDGEPPDRRPAEPIVCVHGNPTWSFYFRAIVSAFRSTHRVVVPDHVGCGLSDKPGDGRYAYTLASRVADLEALLDHLGLDQGITLVVHDWGGLIGLTAALRRPQRIARLVILNTAAFGPPAGRRLPWQLAVIRANRAVAALLVRGFNAFARGAAARCTVRRMSPDVRAGLLAPYDSWVHRIATLRFVQDIPLRPGEPSWELLQWTQSRLEQLRHLPMLIVWGLRDFVFDQSYLDEWRRRFPHASVHAFEDAGHYVLEDRPDDVVRLIRGFVDVPQPSNQPSRAVPSPVVPT